MPPAPDICLFLFLKCPSCNNGNIPDWHVRLIFRFVTGFYGSTGSMSNMCSSGGVSTNDSSMVSASRHRDRYLLRFRYPTYLASVSTLLLVRSWITSCSPNVDSLRIKRKNTEELRHPRYTYSWPVGAILVRCPFVRIRESGIPPGIFNNLPTVLGYIYNVSSCSLHRSYYPIRSFWVRNLSRFPVSFHQSSNCLQAYRGVCHSCE